MQASALALPSAPLPFVAIAPCRIVDTRVATSDGFHQPAFANGETRTFNFPASTGCPGLPATAGAYSVNFNYRPISQASYLTAFPTGTTMPVVATVVGYSTTTFTGNAAIVPAGTSGQIDVYSQYAAHVVIDINGYYAPGGAGGTWLTGGSIGVDGFGGYAGVGVAGTTFTESDVSAPAPMAGTLDAFRVSITESNCSLARTFTLRVNGVATAVTCTISTGSTCSDASHSVAVAVGDLVSVYVPFSGSCVASFWWRARLK